jgi:hypothetical protein
LVGALSIQRAKCAFDLGGATTCVVPPGERIVVNDAG